MSISVLIVDDDEKVLRLLKRYLDDFEFSVSTKSSVKLAFEYLNANKFDLLLLDLNLPDGHGFDLAKFVRSNYDCGIIIISASDQNIDKIVSLEIGADDYIQKPFDLRELLARMRSVSRRILIHPNELDTSDNENKYSRVCKFANVVVNFIRHEVKLNDGNSIHLTSQEFKLLTHFIYNNGAVMTRDKLMDLMNGSSWVPSDRSIDVLISKLRKKLKSSGAGSNCITTIRGDGYKFTQEVEWLNE